MVINIWGQDEGRREIRGSAGFGFRFSGDFHASVNYQNTAIFDTGLYAYGDFIFIELLCGMFFGTAQGKLNYLGAELGLYGKYPFGVTEKINIFPLLGFEFHSALYARYFGVQFRKREPDWKQFWFKTGAGLDYKINDSLNLRFEALYGIRPKSIGGNILENGADIVINDKTGHGLTFRIAIGF